MRKSRFTVEQIIGFLKTRLNGWSRWCADDGLSALAKLQAQVDEIAAAQKAAQALEN